MKIAVLMVDNSVMVTGSVALQLCRAEGERNIGPCSLFFRCMSSLTLDARNFMQHSVPVLA